MNFFFKLQILFNYEKGLSIYDISIFPLFALRKKKQTQQIGIWFKSSQTSFNKQATLDFGVVDNQPRSLCLMYKSDVQET